MCYHGDKQAIHEAAESAASMMAKAFPPKETEPPEPQPEPPQPEPEPAPTYAFVV